MHVKSMQIDKILVKCTRLMVLYRNKNLRFQVRQPLVIKRKICIIFKLGRLKKEDGGQVSILK